MILKTLRTVAAGAAALVLCAAVGCGGGPKAVPVKGAVVKNGQAVKFNEEDTVRLNFAGKTAEGKDVNFDATVNTADGTFTVPGPAGKGLPAGDYKITLSAEIYGPKSQNLSDVERDRFKRAFTHAAKTPLAYKVTETEQLNLVIDIGKKTVSKG